MSASFRRSLIGIAAIALLGWGCGGSDTALPQAPSPWSPPPADRQGTDERPPIIISDGGSVDFLINAVSGQGGEWRQVTSGSDAGWYHAYTTAKPLHHFVITLYNTMPSPPNSANCANSAYEFTVPSFKIKFKGAFSGGTATGTITNDHLQLAFESSDARKDSNDPHQLVSAGFLHWRHLDSIELPSGGPEVCSFKGNSRIQVRQITQ